MRSLIQILMAPLIALVLLLAIPFVLVALICWCVSSAVVCVAVSVHWIPIGVSFLIIYSESPQWKSYFEEEVVPAFGPAARVVNLSRDGGSRKWWHLDWWVYRHCAGFRNRFPIVFHFSRFGRWTTIRFHDAFMQSKKGETAALDQAKANLLIWHSQNV